MASRSLDGVARLRPETRTYMVKGLRFPLHDSADPLVQLVQPYFTNKENVVVAAPPFSGKAAAFMEILNSIETGRKIVVSRTVQGEFCVGPEELGDMDDYDYVVFDNIVVPCGKCRAHVSLFLDYSGLASYLPQAREYKVFDAADPDWYKSATADIVESVAGDAEAREARSDRTGAGNKPLEFTVICARPNAQKVQFVFGTNNSIKYTALQQINCPPHTLIYSREPGRPLLEHCAWTSQIPDNLRCKMFIFGDIEIGAVDKVLERSDNIAFLYTTEDFPLLKELCGILDRRQVAVPEHIRRIIDMG